MKLRFRILVVILFLVSYCDASTQKNPLTGNLVTFATGISHPVCITHAGDCRLFVVNQAGYIYILDSLGNLFPQPFLDIHERVQYGGEEGLLGVAFHPQYQVNGYLFVNYVGPGDSTHISRFRVNQTNPDMADPSSEFKLMTIAQPFSNHKGGDLCFGPDGYLYIGLGDGGSGGDPGNRAQNHMEYLGKMLRIDVNQGNPYSIPVSNPFYNDPSALGEIWALGLRNPWRFSFDRLTGDLWIGDVGQNSVEEVDFQPAASTGGENYGWRCYEGNQVYNGAGCASAATYTFPVHTYPHGEECSISGGYVYRGNTSSYYYGRYFFADYCSDRIWTLQNDGGNWVVENFGRYPGNNFSTFGEDAAGRLYVAGLTSGTIWRMDLTTPLNASVSGSVQGGETHCYSAVNTITSAGESTSFILYPGGSGAMIAGHNILLGINTTVMPGGYLLGRITTDNQFCGNPSQPSVICDISAFKEPILSVSAHSRIYPNPSTGLFVIEQPDDSLHGMISVEIFGILGNKLLVKEFPFARKLVFSFDGQQPGVYFVKIRVNGNEETLKLALTR